MGREILDGNIAASPYKNGQKTACDYCPYHSVCGFDLKTDGYQFRRFDKLSPEEIWGRWKKRIRKRNGKFVFGCDCGNERRTSHEKERARNGSKLDQGTEAGN